MFNTMVMNRYQNKPRGAQKWVQSFFQKLGRISLQLAGKLAHWIWYRPTRQPAPKIEIEWLSQAETSQLQIKGKPLTLYSWGSGGNGPMVLLIHGWGGRAGQMGAMGMALANAGYHAIAIDLPAHGYSTEKKTNLPELAECLLDVTQELGNPVAVIGHSFGAVVSSLAHTSGLEAKKLILISSPARVETIVSTFQKMIGLPDAALKVFNSLFEQRFGKDLWYKFATENLVKKFTAPGLIIHDTDDRELHVSESDVIKKSWNRAESFITTGLGHYRILRNESVIEKVVKFIQE